MSPNTRFYQAVKLLKNTNVSAVYAEMQLFATIFRSYIP
nr:MAG TPA: hypothetical protein [Caudoviricetes sp.]